MRFIAAISLLISTSAVAQMGDYKKIMEERRSKNLQAFHTQLKDFQQTNSQFSNVYFQLGEVEIELFSNLDPITDRVGSRQYIYNAKNYYTLAKGYFDIKEAVKYPEWFNYEKIKDRDSLTTMIQNAIDSKYENTIEYADVYEGLVRNYDKAVANYLQAREGFINIANSYNSLSDLFLRADETLKGQVREIGVKFDSALYYLSLYRDAYQQLPYENSRSVNVILRDIEQFRMNGISPSNFLDDEIELWNYGDWSRKFSSLIEEEVDGLRNEIQTAYSSYLELNQQMVYGEECVQINVDDLKIQRLVNLISKYDERSILIDIFNYVQQKLRYGNQLVYEKHCNELADQVTTYELLSRKARNLQNIFEPFLEADTAAQQILTSSRSEGHFEWFFSEQMTGEEGGKRFAESQISENKESFKVVLSELLTRSPMESIADTASITFQWEEGYLEADPTLQGDNPFQVLFNKVVTDSLMVVCGQGGGEHHYMGLGPGDQDFPILWDVALAESVQRHKALSDSSFALISTGARTSRLTHIYASGRIKSDFTFRADSLIDVFYDGLQGRYTLLSTISNDTVISYQHYNYAGKLTSNKTLGVTGTYLGHLINDQQIWLIGQSEVPDGTVIHATVYSPDFQLQRVYDYSFDQELESTRVIKNDDQTMTVVGRLPASDQLMYSLLDYEGFIKSVYTF